MIKLACNTKQIFERGAMWVLRDYVIKTLAKTIHRHVSTTSKTFIFAPSVRIVANRSHKLLRSYLNVGNFLRKKFQPILAITKIDATILRYIKPANKIVRQYKDTDVCGEGTVNAVFIEDLDPFVFHSFRLYWAQNTRVDLIEVAFKQDRCGLFRKGQMSRQPPARTPSIRKAMQQKILL